MIGLCNVSGWYHNKKIIFAEGSLTPLITSPNTCLKIMWMMDPRKRSTFAGGKDARGSILLKHVTSWIIMVELTPVKNLFAAVFAGRGLQGQKMWKSTREFIQVSEKAKFLISFRLKYFSITAENFGDVEQRIYCTYSAEICLKICFFNVFANVDLQWITNVVSINLFKTCLRKFSWTAWRNKQPKKQNPVLLTMEFHHHSWRQILFWAEMSFAVLFLNHFQKCLIIFLYNFSHNQSNAWWSHWS